MWAKISASATAMACAACLAAAAVTLPAVEKAGSDLAKTADVNVQLAVDLSRLAAFDAIPAYIAFLSSGDFDELGGVDAVNALTTLFGSNGVFGSEGLGIDALLPNDDAANGEPQPGYAALSALPIFFGSEGLFTTGNIDALADYDALSAIPPYIALASGDITALDDLDSLSAINPYIALAGGDITATGDLDSLSAVDTFFGDGPVGPGGDPIGGVFTGGGLDALAPDADGNGGYAALSALPVLFGRETTDNGQTTNFGPGLFNGGGVEALSNYDALSAIPAYLAPTPALTLAAAAPAPPAPLAAQARVAQDPAPTTSTTSSAGSNPVNTFVASLPKLPSFAPQAITPPQLPKVELPKVELPKVDPGGNSGPQLNVSRVSEKFTPKGIDGAPFLFGSGGQGADNGIRGWGDGLKKLGINPAP